MTIPAIDRQKQKKNRLILTVFFVGFSVGVWVLLTFATPYVESLRKQGVMGLKFYHVVEVQSGDTLLVEHEGQVIQVKLAGIRAPRPEWADDSEFTGWTWTDQDLAALVATARKSLMTWVYKRPLALEPPPSSDQLQAGKPWLARATLSRVDLGRKQLQAGQVFMSDEPHDWKEIYQFSQLEAQKEKFGLWRFQPPTTPN